MLSAVPRKAFKFNYSLTQDKAACTLLNVSLSYCLYSDDILGILLCQILFTSNDTGIIHCKLSHLLSEWVPFNNSYHNYQDPGQLTRHITYASLSTNGCTAFLWKLCGHWLKGLHKYHISFLRQATGWTGYCWYREIGAYNVKFHSHIYLSVCAIFEAWTKWQTFCRFFFKCISLKKILSVFTESCSRENISLYIWVSIGAGSGLMPTRWQAITSNNVDHIHWCIDSSLGLSIVRSHKTFLLLLIRNFLKFCDHQGLFHNQA